MRKNRGSGTPLAFHTFRCDVNGYVNNNGGHRCLCLFGVFKNGDPVLSIA